jgi:hypothetical protein
MRAVFRALLEEGLTLMRSLLYVSWSKFRAID